MAIRTREEILNSVRGVIGESADDQTLELLADITDTMTDLENRANNDSENWEQRYRENDAEWRKKYRDRFFSSNPNEDSADEPEQPTRKNYTFENLFKEG